MENVRRRCSAKDGPCISVMLCFLTTTDDGKPQYNFTLDFAHDPHHPPSEDEYDRMVRVNKAMEEVIRKVYETDPEDVLDNYTAKGSLQ